MGGGGRMGRATVLVGVHDDDEEEEEEEGDFEILGHSTVVTPSKAFGRRVGVAATAARDKPPQNLGCPECMVGRLTKRRRDGFRFTETMLVCEKAWDGKDIVGGCGYQIDIGADPVEEGSSRGASAGAGAAERAAAGGVSATVAKAREEIKKLRKKSAREIAREKKEMDEWTAQERARAMANPYAAAVMVAPNAKAKKKIVVDLTDDGEFTSLPPRGPPGGGAVGAYAPIFIDDDEDEIAQPIRFNKPTKFNKPDKLAKITKFDDFGSDDEMDLVRLAEEATEEVKDGMNDEDELVLMELADQFSSPMSAK
ncbi:uncharacterized protein B0H64DRAFT_385528 [Chaetomium fimeti]|uniref:Uncharacterized protein n=1 Tax=Chaetomium fimeti TaxID=1854472 RepID=A0AAE0HL57_9PEZI|nr:hypothetical protein B0H64DRAFT_385528 [Chaetomium fimeti]